MELTKEQITQYNLEVAQRKMVKLQTELSCILEKQNNLSQKGKEIELKLENLAKTISSYTTFLEKPKK